MSHIFVSWVGLKFDISWFTINNAASEIGDGQSQVWMWVWIPMSDRKGKIKHVLLGIINSCNTTENITIDFKRFCKWDELLFLM